jgi:phosphoenolpyruvate carboxykinase (ATP)
LSKIQNSYPVGAHLNHPTNIIMLTCDAFGVLPGVSKLSYEAALFHFASGYTAKVAGTEKGLTEPTAVFSRCFGAPFMPLPLQSYLYLFEKKLNKHKPNVWLINTGWVGGPPGVGKRSSLSETRQIVQSIVNGTLKYAVVRHNSVFNLNVVYKTYNFDPREAWADGAAYDAAAQKLVSLFRDNAQELGIKSFL